MSPTLVEAVTGDDFRNFGEIVAEYAAWCRERYADDVWFVEQVFGHQSLHRELQGLSKTYERPDGVALLAIENGETLGAGAWKLLEPGIAELKRIFVRPSGRQKGIGRRLTQALVEDAKKAGCRLVRLDTANRLVEAISLYELVGFSRRTPYQTYPDALMPYLIFMEKAVAE